MYVFQKYQDLRGIDIVNSSKISYVYPNKNLKGLLSKRAGI